MMRPIAIVAFWKDRGDKTTTEVRAVRQSLSPFAESQACQQSRDLREMVII